MERDFAKLGAPLADLDAAWRDRLRDAEVLFAGGRHAWAIATALYALEIRLKVLICKKLDLQQLPKSFEVHDLRGLLVLAGLNGRMQRQGARKVKLNWDAILSQSEKLTELRYTPDANWSPAQADLFLTQLCEPPNGVLPWLAKQR